MGRLEDLLQQQIDETSRLGKILQEEREAYENIVKRSKYSASNDLSGGLKFVSQLRRSLEEGIVENNKLRTQLKENIAQSSENEKARNAQEQNEIRRLHAKLEDNERWNKSLQSRLDAMQPRGVISGSTGSFSMSRTTLSPRQLGNMENVQVRAMGFYNLSCWLLVIFCCIFVRLLEYLLLLFYCRCYFVFVVIVAVAVILLVCVCSSSSQCDE